MNVQYRFRGAMPAILAACIALLAGCATAPPAETIGPNDPAALAGIRQAYVKLGEQRSWRLRMTTVSDNKTTSSTASFVNPDRFHIVSDLHEQIYVGGNAYMKADGKWQKLPLNFGNIIEQYRKDPSMIESAIGGATVAGREMIDGKPMTVYRYHSTAKFAGGLVSGGAWNRMWVDASGLPRKVESEGRGQVLGFSGGTSLSTIVYYDFGASIRIVAPL